MRADGASGYTLSVSEALDVKALLARASVTSLMNLVQNLPTGSDAIWGALYGLSTSTGQVKDIYYRREESTTEQTWLPARLDSDNRDLHGFNEDTVLGTYGYERGGALTPEAEIVQLIEEKDANGNISIRVLLPSSSPLTSPISVLMFYKSGSQSYTTARELPLFRDATVTGTLHRYVSAVYTDDFKFTPGTAYTLKWRNAGSVHDLVLHADERLVRIADEEDVVDAKAEVQHELYRVEDRVKVLESAPPGTPGTPVDNGETPTTVDVAPYTDVETWTRSGSGEMADGRIYRTGIEIDTDKEFMHIALEIRSSADVPRTLGFKRIRTAEWAVIEPTTQSDLATFDESSDESGILVFPTDDRFNVISLHLRRYRVSSVNLLAIGVQFTAGDTPSANIRGIRYFYEDKVVTVAGTKGDKGDPGGLNTTQVAALIAVHANNASAHHEKTPASTAGGSGVSPASPTELFATHSITSDWTRVRLTGAIPDNHIIVFRLTPPDGVGGGAIGMCTSYDIQNTSPSTATPGTNIYTGALPIAIADYDDMQFAHDTLLVKRTDQFDRLYIKTGRERQVVLQIRAYPLQGVKGDKGDNGSGITFVEDYNQGIVTILGTYNDCGEVTVTTLAEQRVKLEFTCAIETTTTTAGTLVGKWVRGGLDIREYGPTNNFTFWKAYQQGATYIQGTHHFTAQMIDTPGVGTHVYKFQIKSRLGGGFASQQRSLIATL